MSIHNWVNLLPMQPHAWTCGYCGLSVGGNQGYYRNDGLKAHQNQIPQPGTPVAYNLVNTAVPRILICSHCAKPTYFDGATQMPGVAFGNPVSNLPPEVSGLYAEARNSMQVSAFTGAVLLCRKLLMNVAASQGAAPGQHFIKYVDYLANQGYVPPNATGWVNHIRDKGNEATHEIPAASEADAKDLITFIEMILKLIFEFPNRVPGHGSAVP
jgi:hypothetical protein